MASSGADIFKELNKLFLYLNIPVWNQLLFCLPQDLGFGQGGTPWLVTNTADKSKRKNPHQQMEEGAIRTEGKLTQV